jgi:hypothetical protein
VGSTSVFQGVGEGPGPGAVVYDYGRSSGRAIAAGGLLLFAAFYLLVVVLTDDFAGVPGIAPVSRWTAAFTRWGVVAAIPLLVVGYGLLRAAGVVREHYGLALDTGGLWFRDKSRKTFFRIPWDQIRRVATKQTLAAPLRVYLADQAAVRKCPGLKDAKGTTKPLVERGQASVRIPVSGNLPMLREDFHKFAPDVEWQPATARRSGTVTVRKVVVEVVVYAAVVAALVLGGMTLNTISGFQPGTFRGTTSGTVSSCTSSGVVSGNGIGSWSRCRVRVTENGRTKEVVVEPPYLTGTATGSQIQLDRFERKSEYATYDDYAPAGANHRNWLNYVVAVPLMVIGWVMALVALWVVGGDVRTLVLSRRG